MTPAFIVTLGLLAIAVILFRVALYLRAWESDLDARERAIEHAREAQVERLVEIERQRWEAGAVWTRRPRAEA